MNVEREMPKYKSHKEIWALKIKDIIFDHELAKKENRENDGSAIITPEEEGYAPFKVDSAYCRRHNPKTGGYYVVYNDGYKSWSPANAFEKGNTLMSSTKTGIEMFAEERKRQIEVEGFTKEHDGDNYDPNELSSAAACYAMNAGDRMAGDDDLFAYVWPLGLEWWKPTPENRIKELVKAGALLLAEIDLLQDKQ